MRPEAYVAHHIPGRLRIRIPGAKYNPDLLDEIKRTNNRLPNVLDVEGNIPARRDPLGPEPTSSLLRSSPRGIPLLQSCGNRASRCLRSGCLHRSTAPAQMTPPCQGPSLVLVYANRRLSREFHWVPRNTELSESPALRNGPSPRLCIAREVKAVTRTSSVPHDTYERGAFRPIGALLGAGKRACFEQRNFTRAAAVQGRLPQPPRSAPRAG
jgi:hypothetical protein